jgi:hypothetical protein
MIKLDDLVYCAKKKLNGRVLRIRDGLVTIIFVTGEKIKQNKKDIHNVDSQWRIND